MPSSPLLLGHRGSRTPSIAENSFAAFDLAMAHGCDGFELDVRLTRGGFAVVCHDAKVEGVDISSAAANRLPSLLRLEDVLARYQKRAFLDIEMKVSGAEHALLELLRELPPERDYVISSFLPEVILELKARRAIPVGIICESAAQLKHGRTLPADYVIAHESLIAQRLIEDVHSEGRRILAWTINDSQLMLQLADWGIDGIISDDTQLLTATFGRSESLRNSLGQAGTAQRSTKEVKHQSAAVGSATPVRTGLRKKSARSSSKFSNSDAAC